MNDRHDRIRGDVVGWLAAGPEHAPSGLLGRALERTGQTPQRSAIVAMALGAPTGRATWLSPAVRLWLAAALAILALITVIAVIGSQKHDPVVVLPSIHPSQSPATDTLTTPAPSGIEEPAVRARFFGGLLGIVVPSDATTAESSTKDFERVNITSDTLGVTVDRWRVGQPHAIQGLGGTIQGTTIDDLVTSTDALVHGPFGLEPMDLTRMLIDGHWVAQWQASPADLIATRSSPFAIGVVVSGGSVFSFVGRLRGSGGERLALDQFGSMIGSIAFVGEYDLAGLDNRIFLTLPEAVHVALTEPEELVVETDSLPEVVPPAIRVTHATLGDALTIRPLLGVPESLTITGRSLDAYAESLQTVSSAQFSRAHRSLIEIDGKRGYQWDYLSGATFWPNRPTFTIVSSGTDVFMFHGYLGLIDAIRFSAPPPRPTSAIGHQLGDLEVALPDDWIITSSGGTMRITPTGGGGFFAISQAISRFRPGESIVIQRPRSDGGHESFEVSGTSFDGLVASIEAGLGDANRTKVKIGGADGFRWGVPQTWYVEPLVAVAVVEWHGVFYVFQEHIPLDGPPGHYFDTLLKSVYLH